jgi:hypothetical protein
MFRSLRRIAASALLTAFVALSASTATAGNYYKYYEYDDDPSGVVPDTLIMRPLGIAAFFLGVGLFVPSAAMTILVGQPQNLDKPFEALIIKPGKWTFVAPVGTH